MSSNPATVTVTVNNVTPTIHDVTVYKKVYKQEPVNFTASATDPGDAPLTYTWDFGDGTDPVSGESVNHVFADSGEYQATLTVTDADGGTATQTQTVYVGDTAPVETFDDQLPSWDDQMAALDDILNHLDDLGWS